ncbi:MAG TPA: NAD-dependent epimerase/dehydratase family protein [Pyrinomonadaceae bacterium]|jgi:nucleoside-diphosphate-sugar epimerase
MKRSIITGATGFVGANLARRLITEGHEVHLLVRPRHASWRIRDIKEDASLHEVELTDRDSLEPLINSIRPEWIFHLAAHGAYSTQSDIHSMVESNIVGTINLAESCLKAGFETFVNTGTSSEYGFKSFAPAESEQLEPNSYYAVTKASATLLCRHLAQKHEVKLPTLRLYSVYGAFEEPARLMPTLILRGLEGELPPLVAPSTAHDFVYIDDVCDAYLLAATQPCKEYGAIYNVGTGKQTAMREVVEVARRLMGIKAEPEWNTMPGREWDTDAWAANNSKIQKELGWHPRYTFEQGFRRTLDWFREHPEMRELYKEQLKQTG